MPKLRPFSVLFLSALSLACLNRAESAAAQTFMPKAIHFSGVPDYSDDELMAAAGLKKGETVSMADVNQRSQKLMDTGLFQNLTYTFNGQDLVFKMIAADQLFPVRLVNFPFAAGPAFDAKLRTALPLYHGKVPGDGGMLDSVRFALQDQLKAQGIEAMVIATPFSDPLQHKVTAIAFSISTPQVVVGNVQVEPGTVLDKDAIDVVAHLPGKPYDFEGSPRSIERYVANSYTDKGYLEAEVHATQDTNVAIEPYAVRVPFHISVKPRALYHVASIKLAPDMVVSQADFDKQAQVHAGDVADAGHVIRNWEYISRQYHNRGYMKARIEPAPALDRENYTVSYSVSVVPGPVYSMGALSIDNTDPAVRSVLISAWPIKPAAVFNEGAIIGMTATHNVNPLAERLFAAANLKYKLQLNDDTRTVDVIVRLEKRP